MIKEQDLRGEIQMANGPVYPDDREFRMLVGVFPVQTYGKRECWEDSGAL
jgi:hypothetical protein